MQTDIKSPWISYLTNTPTTILRRHHTALSDLIAATVHSDLSERVAMLSTIAKEVYSAMQRRNYDVPPGRYTGAMRACDD